MVKSWHKNGPTPSQTFYLESVTVGPLEYPREKHEGMSLAVRFKKEFGGIFDFSKGGDCGFVKSRGSTIYVSDGHLICRIDSTEQDSNLGPTKTIHLIEGKHYAFIVTGRADSGGKAWLWVEDAENTHYRAHLSTDNEETVAIEFIAQRKQQRLGILFSGGIRGQTFALKGAGVLEIENH